ncbi:uncharacterized protein LOC131936195 [Physella acuta]|uniref:uncharacterized protein LOC131936195 n=1 Tax=Physella acuta TaxID=109671 RepID=UPI0027DDD8C6|nr:uncharacterized protein LOC131936195 [Physella acuta]
MLQLPPTRTLSPPLPASKKRGPSVDRSPTAGGPGPGSTIHKLVGHCPTLTIYLEGVPVTAVIDSGSQVSTVTETFFNCSLKNIVLETGTHLSLRAANGLAIPYNGYFITDLEVNKEKLCDKGFLVIRDPVGGSAPPCLLGMNILQDLTTLAHLVKPPGATPKVWREGKALSPRERTLVPAKSISTIRATGGDPRMVDDMLVQPLEQPFHPDLLVVPGLTSCRDGFFSVQVANLSEEPVYISSRTCLATIHPFELVPPNLQFRVNSLAAEVVIDSSLSSETHTSMPEPSFSSMMAENLDPPQRAALEKLLQEFTDVFAWTDDQLGFTDTIKHSIPLTSDIPVALPYRRLPPTEFAAVKEHIEKLTTRGIIQPSTSPYAAPMVIVKKKNGEIRLCCDYRRLNVITRKDAFPLPRIDETLDALAGSTFFSTLDLASGYHQVAMAEEDQEKTAFVTPFGLYQWTRMPFGLCGAVQTFSRLMQGVMSEHIMRIRLAYLDDILIYAPDFTPLVLPIF